MDENKTNQNVESENPDTSLEDIKKELDRLKAENAKLKSAQSNASADASKYKKQLQERMSEQERAATEANELLESLKAENAALKRNQTIAEYTAGFLGLGYSEELARKAAESTLDGKFSDFLASHKKFVEDHDKALAADALRNVARPGASSGNNSITKEQFAKMRYSERAKLFEEQPELYQELIK